MGEGPEGNGLGAQGRDKLPRPMILIGDKLTEPGPGVHRVARGRGRGGRLGWVLKVEINSLGPSLLLSQDLGQDLESLCPKVEINFLGPKLRAYRSFLGSTLGLTGACP